MIYNVAFISFTRKNERWVVIGTNKYHILYSMFNKIIQSLIWFWLWKFNLMEHLELETYTWNLRLIWDGPCCGGLVLRKERLLQWPHFTVTVSSSRLHGMPTYPKKKKLIMNLKKKKNIEEEEEIFFKKMI